MTGLARESGKSEWKSRACATQTTTSTVLVFARLVMIVQFTFVEGVENIRATMSFSTPHFRRGRRMVDALVWARGVPLLR